MNIRLSLSVAFAAAAVACSTGERPATIDSSATDVAQQTAGAAPARMKRTQRASPGKPTAPIAINHELSDEPQVGQTLEVQITARGTPEMAGLSLDLSSDGAVLVEPFAPEGVAGAVAEERVWTVRVTPLVEVTAYLNVHVKGLLDGQEQVRSVVIPIRTGPAKAAEPNAATPKTDESGEQIISLPAEETP